MSQGNKGMELFLTGWVLALSTNYLGGLDTGSWMPIVVHAMEIFAFGFMMGGSRILADLHKNFKVAGLVALFACLISLGLETICVISVQGTSAWMSIGAIALMFMGDLLFLWLTALVLQGTIELIRNGGDEKTAESLRYRVMLFLTFGTLFVAIQATAILLVNEGLTALTYVVPIMGIPVLIMGVLIAVDLYKIHSAANPL